MQVDLNDKVMAVNDVKIGLAVVNGKRSTEVSSQTFDSVDETVQVDKNKEHEVEEDAGLPSELIYGVMDTPPIHITIISGLQQALLSLATQLVISLLVADAVCAGDRDEFKVKLFSSTLFMNGVTTLAMVLLGVRLPLFQGAAVDYILPLLIIGGDDTTFCNSRLTKQHTSGLAAISANMTENSTTGSSNTDDEMTIILFNVRALSGSLMIAGTIHALLGFTGLIGVLLRFIGPITIISTMMLGIIFVTQAIRPFVEVHWGIALSTTAFTFILSLYLERYNMPIPVWTPSLGFRIIRYPLQKVFSMLISILLNWLLCGILTAAGVLTSDPNHPAYRTRTDARSDVIYGSPWFNFPYPGQFGHFGYSTAAFVSCLIATVLSIFDSIGDYYACAKVSQVPAPPSHAVNRGILIEGICTFFSGTLGCGHATSTYGGNIGAIGLTKVASRQVFLCTGVFYLFFGILGKFSAVFVTIPYPVLGGASVAMFSALFGVVTSNLQVIKLSSSRNMAILGLAIILGLMIPSYVNETKDPFDTGNESFDKVLGMMLGNPMFPGAMLALFLDNTVPGTKEERGIAAWRGTKEDRKRLLDASLSTGYDVYLPLLPRRLLECDFVKFIPFLPKLKGTD